MQETVKDRLIKYLNHKNIGQNAFEKKAGIANGYISHLKHAPGANHLTKILQAADDLNRTWLLTGEGDMLVGDVSGNNNAIGREASVSVNEGEPITRLLDEIREQRRLTEKEQANVAEALGQTREMMAQTRVLVELMQTLVAKVAGV